MRTPTVAMILEWATQALADLEQWEAGHIEAALRAVALRRVLSMRDVCLPVRVAVTGDVHSPPLDKVLQVLGQARSLLRLHQTLSMMYAWAVYGMEEADDGEDTEGDKPQEGNPAGPAAAQVRQPTG